MESFTSVECVFTDRVAVCASGALEALKVLYLSERLIWPRLAREWRLLRTVNSGLTTALFMRKYRIHIAETDHLLILTKKYIIMKLRKTWERQPVSGTELENQLEVITQESETHQCTESLRQTKEVRLFNMTRMRQLGCEQTHETKLCICRWDEA